MSHVLPFPSTGGRVRLFSRGCACALNGIATVKLLQLGSAMIPAIPLLIGIFFTPESPRWLLKKGRVQDAYKSLVRLRIDRLFAARDIYTIYAQIEMEEEANRAEGISHSNFFSRFIELFTIPRNRRATQASGIVMAAQQFCGSKYLPIYPNGPLTP